MSAPTTPPALTEAELYDAGVMLDRIVATYHTPLSDESKRALALSLITLYTQGSRRHAQEVPPMACRYASTKDDAYVNDMGSVERAELIEHNRAILRQAGLTEDEIAQVLDDPEGQTRKVSLGRKVKAPQ